MKNQMEDARKKWAKVARANGWYSEPFYIQVWINESGNLLDSVSFRGMTKDIIIESDGDFD